MNHNIENTSICMPGEELQAYEFTRRLNADERKSLMEWAAGGNSIRRNPFYVYGDDGKLLDFISAYRHCVKEHKVTLRKELKEYELSIVDLTDEERSDLHEWVSAGNSVYDNSFHLVDDSGSPIAYIEAIRIIEEMRENSHEPMPDIVEEIPF